MTGGKRGLTWSTEDTFYHGLEYYGLDSLVKTMTACHSDVNLSQLNILIPTSISQKLL